MPHRTRKRPLYEIIGDEAVNELITIGLSFLIIVFGANYFNFKYAWFRIIQTIGEQSGISQSDFSNEISLMFNAVTQSFPLKYLFGDYNVMQAVLVGFIILGIGLIIKILMRTTKEKFLVEIGRDIYVPAIIGFVSMLIIQIILGVTAHNNYSAFTDQIDSSLMIWQTFGQLIIVGINALIIGSIIKLVAKRRGNFGFKAVGNVLVNSAYISIAYYVVLRIFSLQVILNSNAGGFFKIFLLSGEVTAFFLIFCIFMFAAGLEINKYGRYLRLKKHFEHQQEQKNKPLFSDLPEAKHPYRL
ncbi:MAG: hypothetical protein ABIG93_02780 [archaeon]|nr:hypothetical protein [Nanoarchaeota archaeon]